MTESVDHAEIKLGQLLTMVLSATAFASGDATWMALLGGIFLVTVVYRPASPFVLAYRRVVRPLGWMQSDYRLDNIQPHTFGQFVGALTAGTAAALLHWDYQVAGRSIVAVLLTLTFVSYSGWCVGCFLYYRLQRLGLGGFFARRPPDTGAAWGKRAKRNQTI